MTSVEHIEQRLAHCQALNPRLNAFVEMFSEQAMAQAQACDAALERGESLGPLHGTTVSVKECFQLRGSKSTVNYPPLRNYQAEVTSPLVQRMLDAGAVLLGKTNVPTLLADAQTFGPLYATANNPYDLSCTPDGSTGRDVQRAMDTTIADLTARGASVTKLSVARQQARELLSLWAELFGFMMGQSLSWPVRKVLYWRFSKLLKSSSLPAGKPYRQG